MHFRAALFAVCLLMVPHLSYGESSFSVKNEKVKATDVVIPAHPGSAQFVRFIAAPNGVTLKVSFIKDKGPNAQMTLVDGSYMNVRNLREANIFLKMPGAAQDETYRSYLQVLSQCFTAARLNLRSPPGGSAYLGATGTDKNPVEISFFPNVDLSDPGDALQINVQSFKDLQLYCTN